MKILIVPGTNRAGSLSMKLATLASIDYRNLGHEVDILELSEMGPEYLDPNVYFQPTPKVIAMADRFLAAEGVLFIVPEYNGSFPGILKLYLDTVPFPAGFDKRPCAFIGLAGGQFKALRAVEAVQLVMGYRNAYIYPRRLFIGDSFQAFTEEGTLIDAELSSRLSDQASGFCEFISQVGGHAVYQRS